MINNRRNRDFIISKLLVLIAMFALSACTAPQPTKPVITVSRQPSKTPTIDSTPTIAFTFTPTPQSSPSPILTATPNPILISDTWYADGGDELVNCISGANQPNFILYANGQLVIYKNSRYWESVLSQDEVTSLVNKVENTGILKLDGIKDSGSERLIVGDKVFHFSSFNNPIEEIKQTINILEHFQPKNQKNYVPESLSFWVYPVGSSVPTEYLPRPVPPTRIWSKELKPLSEFSDGFQSISGNILTDVMSQFDRFPNYQTFKDEDSFYISAICADFP